MVLDDKVIKDCVEHLNNQTNALNLLLTVFNWLDADAPSVSVVQAWLTRQQSDSVGAKTNARA